MTNETQAAEVETPQAETVQQFRHKAKASLVQARETLALRSDETKEVYVLLNGQIENIIAGRPGVTQEEQVRFLNEARERLEENLAVLPEKVAAAKAAVLAQIEGWEEAIDAKAKEAVSILREAATFAEERDFEAHQQAKQERKNAAASFQYTEGDEGDEGDED